MQEICFSQSKLADKALKIEEKVDVVDQKLDLFLSFFLNQDANDAKLGEKALKTKCSTTLKFHKDKDPERGDTKRGDFFGGK